MVWRAHEVAEDVFGHWPKVPDVDADVDHPIANLPALVYVAVEQPGTVVDGPVGKIAILVVAVAPVREVAGQGGHAGHLELDDSLPDLVEPGGEVARRASFNALAVTGPAPVVVAGEEHLVSVQQRYERKRVIESAEGEVTEHDDLVVIVDGRVPALDEGSIHLIDIAERPVAVLDDVLMSEMKIGREKPRHDRPGSHFSSRRGCALHLLH